MRVNLMSFTFGQDSEEAVYTSRAAYGSSNDAVTRRMTGPYAAAADHVFNRVNRVNRVYLCFQ
jgi:hypothetical protein